MKIDVQTLGTFNQLAHEGAEQAADSLQMLAGFSPTVEPTTIDLATRDDVMADVRGRDLVGVAIEFDNALAGTALVMFDRAGARTLAKHLPGDAPADEADVHARVEEVANILVSGFVDGWADHLDAAIDMTEPTLLTGSGSDVLAKATPFLESADRVLSFKSALETAAAAVDASIYIVPEPASFERMVAQRLGDDGVPIPLDRLQVFNRMTARGADRASENITAMTGIETSVEVSRMRVVPLERMVGDLGDDPHVGLVMELDGLPSGYLLVLFDTASAGAIAERMGTGPVEDGFGDMHRSAIEEIANIMSSGFIDGWANVLGTSITHTPPEFVHDYPGAIMDAAVTQLAAEQRYAFVFDSLIETDDRAFSCEIFALPNESELERALLDLEGTTAGDEAALADAMDADPGELF